MQPPNVDWYPMATMKTIINRRPADLVTDRKVRLRPGENVMDAEKARVLAESKVGQLWFSLGWIGVKPADAKPLMSEELASGAEDEGTADTTPPGPMSARDAIDFVAAEDDAVVLSEMLEDEDRVTVKAAIERRLADLSGPSEPHDFGSSTPDAGED